MNDAGDLHTPSSSAAKHATTHTSSGDLPEASIRPSPTITSQTLLCRLRSLSATWLLVLGAIIVSLLLLISNWKSQGPAITISFEQGHGLQPGDKLRLRGMDVGEIEGIVLSPELTQVRVLARLTPEAAKLAREGTLFWIERAQISVANVRGLDTLIGPKYIGVQPGPENTAKLTEFVGIESPRQSSETGNIPISVRFRHGHGLRAGSPVRFRGVDVGEVVDVVLADNLRELVIQAELDATAKGLARTGSIFWIERPKIGIAETRGLDTLVTGAYLAVSPGPESAPYGTEFEGSETPPSETDTVGGIEIILESPVHHGLQQGAPVRYRGIVVGEVLHVGLASDAASVEIRLYVEPTYRKLVCGGSVFWPTSGIDFQLGLSGLKVESDPISSVTSGGVSFATSEMAGKPVASGHRFVLSEKKEDDWDNWRPQLTVGPQFNLATQQVPQPVRASFYWKQKRWGVTRSNEHHVWVQPLEGNRLLCPLGLSLAAITTDSFTLEARGESKEIGRKNIAPLGNLALIRNIGLPKLSGHIWQENQCRIAKKPEDCLLRAGNQTIPVAAARLAGSPTWQIDESIGVDEDWNGASVIARADAALIGVLTWHNGEAIISPLTDGIFHEPTNPK